MWAKRQEMCSAEWYSCLPWTRFQKMMIVDRLSNCMLYLQFYLFAISHLVWTWFTLISQSIKFWSKFIPINRGGRIYPTLTAISPAPTLHLPRFKESSLSKPTLLLSSTCVFHVFLGHPRLLLPFTSNSNAFLKTCPSSLASLLYNLDPWMIRSGNSSQCLSCYGHANMVIFI